MTTCHGNLFTEQRFQKMVSIGVKVQPLQLPKELAMDGKNLEKTTWSLSMRLSTQFTILQIALVF